MQVQSGLFDVDRRHTRHLHADQHESFRALAGKYVLVQAAEQLAERALGVGDHDPPGAASAEPARPSRAAPRRRDSRSPTGPSTAAASSAVIATPVSSSASSSASAHAPLRAVAAVHQPFDRRVLDRRAVDVGVEADVAVEDAVGGGNGLAPQLDGAAAVEAAGEVLEPLDDAGIGSRVGAPEARS